MLDWLRNWIRPKHPDSDPQPWRGHTDREALGADRDADRQNGHQASDHPDIPANEKINILSESELIAHLPLVMWMCDTFWLTKYKDPKIRIKSFISYYFEGSK